jgi:hypothetical protein
MLNDTWDAQGNDTLWWDGLEGDTLACRPGHEGSLELACMVITRIVPGINFISGFAFVAVALVKVKRGSRVHSSDRRASTNYGLQHTKYARLRTASYGAVMSWMVGLLAISKSAAWWLSGHGTIHPSNTIPGIAGDAFCKYIHGRHGPG